jgi:KaiC/GvpD/RAD55 family RecA-like ATPase
MVSTGLEELDRLLNQEGYPPKSTILVVGPPGVGKEALGYWFTNSGLAQGDFCVYITTLSVSEVLQDFKAYRVDTQKRVPMWIAGNGGELKLDVNDLPGLSFNLKETLRRNAGRKVRIATDVLSSLLMLNPADTVYRFLSQLFAETKQYDSVFLATIEDGMHQPNVLASMEQLFDGVIQLRLYEKGMRLIPLLRVSKMRGSAPQPVYFQFSFDQGKMEIRSPIGR